MCIYHNFAIQITDIPPAMKNDGAEDKYNRFINIPQLWNNYCFRTKGEPFMNKQSFCNHKPLPRVILWCYCDQQ